MADLTSILNDVLSNMKISLSSSSSSNSTSTSSSSSNSSSSASLSSTSSSSSSTSSASSTRNDEDEFYKILQNIVPEEEDPEFRKIVTRLKNDYKCGRIDSEYVQKNINGCFSWLYARELLKEVMIDGNIPVLKLICDTHPLFMYMNDIDINSIKSRYIGVDDSVKLINAKGIKKTDIYFICRYSKNIDLDLSEIAPEMNTFQLKRRTINDFFHFVFNKRFETIDEVKFALEWVDTSNIKPPSVLEISTEVKEPKNTKSEKKLLILTYLKSEPDSLSIDNAHFWECLENRYHLTDVSDLVDNQDYDDFKILADRISVLLSAQSTNDSDWFRPRSFITDENNTSEWIPTSPNPLGNQMFIHKESKLVRYDISFHNLIIGKLSENASIDDLAVNLWNCIQPLSEIEKNNVTTSGYLILDHFDADVMKKFNIPERLLEGCQIIQGLKNILEKMNDCKVQ